MAQNTQVTAPVRRYTRADFTALRARLNKLPVADIMGLYYHEDDLVALGIETSQQMEDYLTEMREHLAERALLSNPLVAQTLADARRLGNWSKTAVDFIFRAADTTATRPQPTDSVSVWLKPRVAAQLREEGIVSLAELKATIEIRGPGWWRPIPHIGAGKAAAIEHWYRSHAVTLGELPAEAPLAPASQLEEVRADRTQPFVPLERMGSVVRDLDGSQGRNRNQTFCLIAAKNDLEAVQAYLYRFRDREKTYRAYQKELERFLLWCIRERGVPLSGVLTEECEAYKDFLARLPASWVGPKTLRHSSRWRPFASALQPGTQRYAVQALRTFFDWLVKVRYLGGNPWVTVSDPRVAQKEVPLDIDKALPESLWDRVAAPGGLLDLACEAPDAADAAQRQYRLARAAILLLGHTGLRREEAANAIRSRLKPLASPEAEGFWELAVLGKRNKWRTVFLPPRCIEALRAHWLDREHEFAFAMHDLALISPVTVPGTPTARAKHLDGTDGALTGNGFSADGLYRVVKTTILRLADDYSVEMPPTERDALRAAAPHALRHTFATHAAANEMPQDVLQRLLGHASQTTTSIYVRAERTRTIAEVTKMFGKSKA